jgi:hypothetical protein
MRQKTMAQADLNFFGQRKKNWSQLMDQRRKEDQILEKQR